MTSKTFCILPWIHTYVNPDGSVLPCCIGDYSQHLGNVQQDKVVEIWNSEKYQTMRQKMLTGERCTECVACYNNEDAGVKSFRQHVNEEYAEFIPSATDTSPPMNLKYLDVRWSNICNFKCRTCSSTYSSSWATEDNKHGADKKVFIFAGGVSNDDLYSQFEPYLGTVKEIYFAGGEPLLTDKHYDILDKLIATGNTDIKLRYSTNLSSLTYKQKNIVDYWNKFSRVIVYVSLDSWGERAEYIREGTEWQTIEQNIKFVKANAPSVYLGVSSVVSAFNVATLPEFLYYLNDNDLFDQNSDLSLYTINNPDYYSFDILNDEIKSKILIKLRSSHFTNNIDNKISDVIARLVASQYNENLRQTFLIKTHYYDHIRNRDFKKTFPELNGL